MIGIRLSDCAQRPYGDILRILHAPVTDEAAAVLQRLLPDLMPARQIRHDYVAGGRFTVHGDLLSWHPQLPRPDLPAAPSLLEQALHLAGTLGRAAADLAEGRPLMSADAELARRLRICQACPMLHDGQCRRCGCPVGRKALVASEPCPEGRW